MKERKQLLWRQIVKKVRHWLQQHSARALAKEFGGQFLGGAVANEVSAEFKGGEYSVSESIMCGDSSAGELAASLKSGGRRVAEVPLPDAELAAGCICDGGLLGICEADFGGAIGQNLVQCVTEFFQ